MFVVKWRHIQDNEYHDFEPKAQFDNLQDAQDYIHNEIETDNGMYAYRIFEE